VKFFRVISYEQHEFKKVIYLLEISIGFSDFQLIYEIHLVKIEQVPKLSLSPPW